VTEYWLASKVGYQAGHANRAVLGEGVEHLLFQDVLQPDVQGERQVGAVDGRLQFMDRTGDQPSGHVLLGQHGTRRPGQAGILGRLDAVLADPIHVHEAQDLRRQAGSVGGATHGVHAARLCDKADAGQVQRANSGRGLDVNPSAQPGPGLVAAQRCLQLGSFRIQDARQQQRRQRGILDRGRRGKDRLGTDGCRQDQTRAIEDEPSRGRDLLGVRQLGQAHVGQPLAVDDLPPDQAIPNHPGHDGRHQQHDHGPDSTVGSGEHGVSGSRAEANDGYGWRSDNGLAKWTDAPERVVRPSWMARASMVAGDWACPIWSRSSCRSAWRISSRASRPVIS
jgi:hypothetical protein